MIGSLRNNGEKMRFKFVNGPFKMASRNTLYSLIFLVSITVYVCIAAHSPLSILVWQGFDDMLFIRLGQSLAEGRWLGDFNELTLVKGPGYPFFLAVNSWLGFPISIAHALFFCTAVVAASILVLKVGRSRILALLVFLILLFDPRILELDRVIRDAIYSGQSIFLLAIIFYAAFVLRDKGNYISLSFIGGAMFGWLWLTREEGVWLLPALFLIYLFAYVRSKPDKSHVSKSFFTAAGAYAVILLIFYCGNYLAYGAFAGVDVKEHNFMRAIKAMESIRVEPPIPYVGVSKQTRFKLYEISRSFAHLKKYIDPDTGVSPFEEHGGCEFRRTACGQISNGFFFWAVRDAAGKAGFYETPKQASEFYDSIASEINQACDLGKVQCSANIIPYMPPISWSQLKEIPLVTSNVWRSMTTANPLLSKSRWNISGPQRKFDEALLFLNYPKHYSLAGDEGVSEGNMEDIRAKSVHGLRASVVVLYSAFLPFLIPAGIVFFLAGTYAAIRNRDWSDIFVLSSVIWLAVLTRIAVLILVDISSFPAIINPYMQPIYTLSVLASILSIWSVLRRPIRTRFSAVNRAD